MSELLAVTEEVLLLAGAEVEALDCERLDVLLPRDLQTKLSLTELAHLGVSEAANTTVVSLTSDWMDLLDGYPYWDNYNFYHFKVRQSLMTMIYTCSRLTSSFIAISLLKSYIHQKTRTLSNSFIMIQ